MNSIIKEQLSKLEQYVCEVDGKSTSHVEDDFTTVVFKDVNGAKMTETKVAEIRVIFEDYIIHPYAGFDFHTKFNNNVAPPNKSMHGTILKETEKMLYMNLTDDNGKVWIGWCPKKSCHIV